MTRAPRPAASTTPTPAAPGPGTTPKGEARRQALVAAVLRVLERGGPNAVTHRAVAEEARLPLAAATYYFASRDDMLATALRVSARHWTSTIDAIDTPTRRDLAALLVRYTGTDRAAALAQYELLFAAMRTPALRDSADTWYSSLDALLERLGVGAEVRSTAALALDGLVLRMLWRGDPADVDQTDALLETLIGDALGPSEPRPSEPRPSELGPPRPGPSELRPSGRGDASSTTSA
ncbi:TetR/AcrR family transcriptional regulator [Frigoribacterium sp. 2-23]|uniref:TetR/AcrR family transcriptional regulator n=1 Tax=Frigoribacterium sp. 2-23 TaxID=3415006 RepID=UPI003C6FDC08